jgi:CDP-diacylglycerol--glycerol-3-phosphate 3-phosphatidyltransferase
MPAAHPRLTHLPNAISVARILIAPVALWSAWSGNGDLYKGLFTAAVVSDFLDGAIARLFKLESDLGARLDAFADMLTYLVLFFAICWLWPGFIYDRIWLLGAGFILYSIGYVVGFLRFRRLNAFHTWAGKTTAVLMACGMIIWFAGGPGWFFTAAVSFSLLSGIEQIAIAAVIPKWRTGVPTLWHAWRQRSEAGATHP